MLDRTEVARVLDILGNRNRRRIIELLRQKPCFVTEISDRLMLSPKAVIEHLQMMEREEILSSHLDERRRKYYYLANDINVVVNFQRQETIVVARTDKKAKFRHSLSMMRKMVHTREELVSHLQHIEKDIDQQIREIIEGGREIFRDEHEIDLVIALSHCDLSLPELGEVTSIPEEQISVLLDGLIRRDIVERKENQYRIRGIDAE
ncbi:MAG: ArsR family transcriptional regulator [Methanoregulaceae archaeon]|nr:ArsR family transcriptional regulator [Methanoregulaceae archaeon]